MNELLLTFFSQTINCAVTNIVIFMFFRRVYTHKKKNTLIYVLVCILSTFLMKFANTVIASTGFLPLNSIYAFIYYNMVCKLLYDTKQMHYLLYNIVFVILLIFSDAFSVLILTFVMGIPVEDVLANFQYVAVSCLINVVLIILIYNICVIYWSKSGFAEIKKEKVLFLLLMTLLEIYIIYNYFLKVESRTDAISAIFFLIGFVFLNISFTHLLKQISDVYKYKYELAITKRQNEIQLNFYNELKEKFNQSQKIAHDIKKHLSAVNDLQTNDRERAAEYSSMIETKVNELYCCFKCSNQILSIIMSRNILTAESENIKVETRVEDVTFEFVDDMDITAIFANMWDNAIEACCKIDEDKRYINIDIEKISGFILINMENSFDGKIIKKNGEILSTKSEHEGVGISIIRDTVSKYGGVMCVVYDIKCFRLEITMPVPVK